MTETHTGTHICDTAPVSLSPPLLVAAPPLAYCLHHVTRAMGSLCQQGGSKMQPPRNPSGAKDTVCALKQPNFDTLQAATSQTDAARRPNFAGSPSTLWLSPPRVSPTLHSRGRALALQILQTEPASTRSTLQARSSTSHAAQMAPLRRHRHGCGMRVLAARRARPPPAAAAGHRTAAASTVLLAPQTLCSQKRHCVEPRAPKHHRAIFGMHIAWAFWQLSRRTGRLQQPYIA